LVHFPVDFSCWDASSIPGKKRRFDIRELQIDPPQSQTEPVLIKERMATFKGRTERDGKNDPSSLCMKWRIPNASQCRIVKDSWALRETGESEMKIQKT